MCDDTAAPSAAQWDYDTGRIAACEYIGSGEIQFAFTVSDTCGIPCPESIF